MPRPLLRQDVSRNPVVLPPAQNHAEAGFSYLCLSALFYGDFEVTHRVVINHEEWRNRTNYLRYSIAL